MTFGLGVLTREIITPTHHQVIMRVKQIHIHKEHRIRDMLLLLLLSHFGCVQLCVTHRRQPTSLLCPWDSPGKNTGVGCHFLLQCMKVKSEREVAQSCLTLCDPTYCSPPGSSALHKCNFQVTLMHFAFEAPCLAVLSQHWEPRLAVLST